MMVRCDDHDTTGCDRATTDLSYALFSIEYSSRDIEIYPLISSSFTRYIQLPQRVLHDPHGPSGYAEGLAVLDP